MDKLNSNQIYEEDTLFDGCKVREKLNQLMAKLKEYEDLETRGLLVRFPCKPGDLVWVRASDIVWLPNKGANDIYECKVINIETYQSHTFVKLRVRVDDKFVDFDVAAQCIDTLVFTSYQDAQKSLYSTQ